MIIQHDFIQISCTDVTWLILRRSDFKIYKLITSKNDTGFTGKSNQTINDDSEDYDTFDKELFSEDDKYMDMTSTENFDFDQFLVQVYPKPEVLKRTSIVPSDNGTGLNVIVIGLDSLSHLSFQRLLPRTYHLLRDELDFTIMNGYNIAGDGTTANLIPMLTG